MGVALENARLFDETQRLLKETEQRNAELAIINSVQAALAAELNIQGIYDSVGDKIREIFQNRDMGIRIYDPKTDLIHYPYTYENGQRLTLDSEPLGGTGFAAHVLRTRETLVINENMAQSQEKYGSYTLPGTQIGEVCGPGADGGRRPGARRHQHGRRRARARVQRLRRPAAADAGQQHERGAGKRAAVRRDAAPVQGERAARGRARDHQQRAGRRLPPNSTSRASTTLSATRSAISSTRQT